MDPGTCQHETCDRFATHIDPATGGRFCRAHAPLGAEERWADAPSQPMPGVIHYVDLGDVPDVLGTFGRHPAVRWTAAVVTLSAALILAALWWLDAHLLRCWMGSCDELTARQEFLANRGSLIVIVLGSVAAMRLAGYRWLVSLAVPFVFYVKIAVIRLFFYQQVGELVTLVVPIISTV